MEKDDGNIVVEKKSLIVKISTFAIFFLFLIAAIFFFIREYRNGHFKNIESIDEYIESYGAAGPVILTIFQCVKVLYAVIPGALGCIAGATMFGTLGGFICSYIGICCGSMLAFLLSRKFGVKLMHLVFSQRRYDKSMKWLERHKGTYSLVLWLAILFPFSPDDFLCYFSGLTNISFRRFAIIILTAKPWTILAYSLIFGELF